MTESEGAVLAYWKEHREQLRQSENQRAVLTNYVLVITAAVSGLIVQQQFSLRTLPLSILIVVTGLYGALAAAKYHERAGYHLQQAQALTRVLVEAGGLADSSIALGEFRQAHYREYPRLSRLRLHWLWTRLHLGVAVYGAVLIILTCLIR